MQLVNGIIYYSYRSLVKVETKSRMIIGLTLINWTLSGTTTLLRVCAGQQQRFKIT